MGYSVKQVTGFAMAWRQIMQNRKKFIMSHPYKKEIANKIINARKNSKIITFSEFIKDAESFGFGYVLHSKKKKDENRKIIEEFKILKHGVLHTAKAANAGLNCPDINCEIRLSVNSSSINTRQILGRGLRYVKDKTTEMFTLVLRGTVDEYWFNKSHVGISYITINEDQLDRVLNGENVETRKRDDLVEYRF